MLRFLTAIFSAINACVAELCSGAALAPFTTAGRDPLP